MSINAAALWWERHLRKEEAKPKADHVRAVERPAKETTCRGCDMDGRADNDGHAEDCAGETLLEGEDHD
jgi:hypothetical protein